ncbi:MAG TPA: branched-chain amino acid ABC transporter permease [Candidatus Nanoarchaeia archaeon]|nr:branched-chain amino acid ABC transporter permease [Candidatus Nanoarchaeia archaeon]
MTSLSILPQLLINGLIAGSVYALAGAGFSLVYYVMRFQYFSQGAVITIAAYSFFYFLNSLGLSYIFAVLLTCFVGIAIAMLTNWLIYRPLRKRKATPTILLIASIVLLIFSSSLVLALFGSSTKTLSLSDKNITFDFGYFTITAVEIAVILAAIIFFGLIRLLLKKTRVGKAMRAIADNKDVAQIVGINPEKIYAYVFVISGILGAIAGMLIGLEQNLYPRMGVLIIIKGFVGAVIGGLGSVPGTLVGGFFVGLAENLGIWLLPSYFKDIISFTLLLLFLLFRPQGLFGVRMRDDA